jgi:orotidine-5'-phosphate decarboxylase
MPLSTLDIPRRDRLMFAMDVKDAESARRLATELGDSVSFYKLGLELAMAPGYWELVDWFTARGNKVFADLKFLDIPATVQSAVRQVAARGATYCTLHAHRSVIQAAAEVKGDLKLLAVTVLTAFDRSDVDELGLGVEVAALTQARARAAREAGADGIVCSGHEATALRGIVGPSLAIVTPGIRAEGERGGDDQKRVMSAREAFLAGADHIVVGRPIRNAPDPRAAALEVQRTIAELFPR